MCTVNVQLLILKNGIKTLKVYLYFPLVLQLRQPSLHLNQHILVLTTADSMVKIGVCSSLLLIVLVVVLLTFNKRTHTVRQTVQSVK